MRGAGGGEPSTFLQVRLKDVLRLRDSPLSCERPIPYMSSMTHQAEQTAKLKDHPLFRCANKSLVSPYLHEDTAASCKGFLPPSVQSKSNDFGAADATTVAARGLYMPR